MSAILLLIAILAAGYIETSEACPTKMDLCLVLDASATVCGGNEPCDNWKHTIEFSKNVTATLDIGSQLDHVALMTFTNTCTVEWNLQKYSSRDPLLSAIGRVQFKGMEFNDLPTVYRLVTDIFNPLYFYGNRYAEKNVILMVTDGIPLIDPATAKKTALAVQAYGITYFVVCIQPRCTEVWAESIASIPVKAGQKTVFLVDSYALLYTVLDTVLENICYFLEDDKSQSVPPPPVPPSINLNISLIVG